MEDEVRTKRVQVAACGSHAVVGEAKFYICSLQ